ncbi:hypothetical protein AB1Y20_014953 [Prymnesium parvum]|uniref:DNA-directed DNA polymerase n=1 Tax=Prymnesium parvum TaxID=97485 RepID=A0AB34JWE6_PRYPA
MTEMPNGEWRVELYKEIQTHFNRQHVACEILSTSKNIMNEVMCTAEDIGAPIYYTDTDSMHMEYADVNRLADEFKTRYGRTLIGKQLGQFHVDFDFDGAVGEIHSEEAVFIGKKTYIDVLRDEAGNRAYHIRCKGIPSKCIDHTVRTQYAHDPLRCFMDFYDGKSVVFNLSAGGSAVFKISKRHTVSTVELKRKVGFPPDVDRC